jgi:hypothetical protein
MTSISMSVPPRYVDTSPASPVFVLGIIVRVGHAAHWGGGWLAGLLVKGYGLEFLVTPSSAYWRRLGRLALPLAGFVRVGGIVAAIINAVIGAVILLVVVGFFKKE